MGGGGRGLNAEDAEEVRRGRREEKRFRRCYDSMFRAAALQMGVW